MSILRRIGLLLVSSLPVAVGALVATVGRQPRDCAALETLDNELHTYSASVDARRLVDACLDVCRAVPGPHSAAAVPTDADALRAAADFFDWDRSNDLGQHLFDAALWDDAFEALARAVTAVDAAAPEQVLEAARAVAASAHFVLLEPEVQRRAIDELSTLVASEPFLDSRRQALSAVREQRTEKVASVDDAFVAARRRRLKHDFVAVAPEPEDDENVIRALYRCTVQHLSPSLLLPLGFPPSKLGLRSFVAATREGGSQRAAAALGTVWHAANEPAPLILSPPLPAAAAASHTLVIVFSSLGWHGVVRAEYGATLRAVGDGSIAVAHALDTAQSWFTTDPSTGEFDDGQWWDRRLSDLCAPFARVCILGESMGASAALRFARHATSAGSVVALVPQIDVRDFPYAGRADFTDERKHQLREAIVRACAESEARLVLHVGEDPPDLRQLAYLPDAASERARVVRHSVPGHALGAGLKAQGQLRKTVLSDLLGHSYRLPPARLSAPQTAERRRTSAPRMAAAAAVREEEAGAALPVVLAGQIIDAPSREAAKEALTVDSTDLYGALSRRRAAIDGGAGRRYRVVALQPGFLNVHSSPGDPWCTDNVVLQLPDGAVIQSTAEQGDWVHHDAGGWSIREYDGHQFLVPVE